MAKFRVFLNDKFRHGRNDIVSGFLVETYDCGVYEAATKGKALAAAKAAVKAGGRRFKGTQTFQAFPAR